MTRLRCLKARFFQQRPSDVWSESFSEEMHFQASRILWLACASSFIWLPYVAVDRALYPGEPLIVMLRYGLLLAGIITFLLNLFEVFQRRSQWLLMLWGGYLLVATGIITGLTRADPTYVAGFILVLSLLVMAPVEKKYAYSVLGLTLFAFAITCQLKGMGPLTMRSRYTLQDIGAALIAITTFIYLMDRIRYRSWDSTRQIAQEARRRALESESESRAKSRFLAAMSHEIRTPMNGVLGMAQLLLDTGLKAEQRAFAQIIASSGENLLKIVDDILDYSKIEAGRMDIEQVDVDLEALCAGVMSILSPEAEKKQLALKLLYAPGTPLQVRTDPTRLQQILLNLLGNAIKFTASGWVALRVRREEDGSQGIRLYFEVEDTGIGLTPAQIDALFQAFSQADASTARRFGGTGLGLSISRSLVQLMGGEIGVTSAEGAGSTFWFRIHCGEVDAEFEREHALVRAPAAGMGPVAAHGSLPPGTHVLVVEDNGVNQLVIRSMLTQIGTQLTIAGNGREGLELFTRASTPYDVVLMDCEMPEMDGLEAARAMRRLEAEQGKPRTPIIALTAHAFAEDRAQCLRAGMDDFISKPVGLVALREMLLKHRQAGIARQA